MREDRAWPVWVILILLLILLGQTWQGENRIAELESQIKECREGL